MIVSARLLRKVERGLNVVSLIPLAARLYDRDTA
jgi:hypothetical protein